MKFFKDKKLEVDVYTSEIKLIENHIASILGRLNKLEELSIKPEPVAWMQVPHKDNKPTKFSLVKTWEDDIPLYTHPVKEHDIGISHAIGFDDGFKAGMQRAVEMNVVKELTDEEILECWNETHPAVVCLNAELPLFARAILRKSQEK